MPGYSLRAASSTAASPSGRASRVAVPAVAGRRLAGLPGRAGVGGVALAMAALLGGCATAPRSTALSGVPVNAESGCHAPPPNLRAAYNRPYRVKGRTYVPLRDARGYDERGTASWYGWESGSTTAMGVRFTPREFTAASRVLPLPTCVQVTNLDNGRSALVLVNDRGPFVDGRLLDLSYGAATALGVAATGTAPVRVVALPDGASGPLQVAAAAPPPSAARSDAGSGAVPLAPQRPAAAVRSDAALPQQFEPVTSASSVAPAGGAPMIVQALAPLAPASAPAEAASQAGTPPAPSPSPGASAADAGGGEADRGGLPQPALQLASAAAPAAGTTPAEMAAPALPGDAQSFVQTGAFTLEANARVELARLQAAGIRDAQIVPGYVGGRTYYRVQIGPLDGPSPDAALLGRLEALGLRGYSVVQQ